MAVSAGPSHVWRPSLPWRTAIQTECGLFPKGELAERCVQRDAIDSFPHYEKGSYWARRGYLNGLCFTCQDVVKAWPTWDKNPVRCLARESGRTPINFELRALAALVDAHRDEFNDRLEAELVLGTLLEMGR
jgi:hypothetical protein